MVPVRGMAGAFAAALGVAWLALAGAPPARAVDVDDALDACRAAVAAGVNWEDTEAEVRRETARKVTVKIYGGPGRTAERYRCTYDPLSKSVRRLRPGGTR